MFKKTITIMLIVALFGLTALSGCGKKDDAKKPAEDATTEVEDAAK